MAGYVRRSVVILDDPMTDQSLPSSRIWTVLKFGGTSVAKPENWAVIAKLAKARIKQDKPGGKVLIVHSALSGVSNRLEALPDKALSGDVSVEIAAIKAVHLDFAENAALDGSTLLASHFETLDRLAAGIALVREASPRVRAELLALGEQMASVLGMERLRQEGLSPVLLDARDALTASSDSTDASGYLSNSVIEGADPALQARLDSADLVLTQGFIARNGRGETVLLGRGGSDTSAAYFANKLEAAKLEIWTDVPGLFSADPRLTEGARLLQALSYDEAQEIATMGGKVLHPRCIGPARRANVPARSALHLAAGTRGHLDHVRARR
jgi:diaminopimelate decarboxylase/aspartate kinase